MNLLAWPLIISLFSAALCMALWQQPLWQRRLGLVGSGANALVAIVLLQTVLRDGVQVLHIANWHAPFGITLVADLLSAIMVAMTAVMGLSVHFYSWFCMDRDIETYGFHSLFHFLLLGVYSSFLTGDIFNLYVSFEIMLIASFVLLALGNRRAQIEGALKYMALNLFGSFLFLGGAGILYGLLGTLNMADVAVKLASVDSPSLTNALALVFLVAFGLKAAVFPFFSWLPASYHTPPSAVSAIFAALLTKVGVYCLMRFFSLIFVGDQSFTHEIIAVIGLSGMVFGVLGAVSKNEIRRILSFHSISQIGYMIFGFAMMTPLAIAGALFYVLHHSIVKSNLFLIGGAIHRIFGSYHLSRLGGLYRSHPFLAAVFLITALSLAGLPPLSGFFAKIFLVQAAFLDDRPLAVFIMLAVGLFTLISMSKIFDKAFWKPLSSEHKPSPIEPSPSAELGMMIPITFLAILTLLLGVGVPFAYDVFYQAAEQILNPSEYIDRVLGGAP